MPALAGGVRVNPHTPGRTRCGPVKVETAVRSAAPYFPRAQLTHQGAPQPPGKVPGPSRSTQSSRRAYRSRAMSPPGEQTHASLLPVGSTLTWVSARGFLRADCLTAHRPQSSPLRPGRDRRDSPPPRQEARGTLCEERTNERGNDPQGGPHRRGQVGETHPPIEE